MFFLFIGYVFVVSDFKLPMAIMFLPFKSLPFAWTVNYLFQTTAAVLGTCLLFLYWPMVLISMNNSCYKVDVAILHANNLDAILESNGSSIQQRKVEDATRKLIQSCGDIVEWQNQARRLWKFDFLLEFVLLTLITCLAAFTITSQVYVADVLNLGTGASQLLVYCLMGSRVESRFKMLASALYEVKWNSLPTRNQKDLQLALMMVQNIKSFDGIFDMVDLQTFRKVRTTQI